MDTETQLLDPYKKRRWATRSRLVAAAKSVMAAKSIEAITIDEITLQAGVGKGSFYNHFESKEELFIATLDDVIAGIAGHITEAIRNTDDPAEILSIGIRLHINLATIDPGIGRLIVNASASVDFLHRYADPVVNHTIDKGIKSGRFAIRDRDLFFMLLTTGLNATIAGQLDGRLNAGTEIELARSMLLLAGLSPDYAEAVASKPLPMVALAIS